MQSGCKDNLILHPIITVTISFGPQLCVHKLAVRPFCDNVMLFGSDFISSLTVPIIPGDVLLAVKDGADSRDLSHMQILAVTAVLASTDGAFTNMFDHPTPSKVASLLAVNTVVTSLAGAVFIATFF
jgi:hypothetical protein